MTRTRIRTGAVAIVAAATVASAGQAGRAAATAGRAPAPSCSTPVGCGGPWAASPAVQETRSSARLPADFGVLSSANWAGYAGEGTDFTDVRATWRVPALDCAKVPTASYVAEWAGID